MKKNLLMVLLLTFLFLMFGRNIYADDFDQEAYDACTKKCEESYSSSMSVSECKKQCNVNAGGTNGAVVPEGFDSLEEWTEYINEQIGKDEGEGVKENDSAGAGFDPTLLPNMYEVDTNVKNIGRTLSATIFTVLQIAAFAGIIIAGIKYMYSSADQRADMKNSMLVLCSGMVLVFGASTIAKFSQKVANGIYEADGEMLSFKEVTVDNTKLKYAEYSTNERCSGEKINKIIVLDDGRRHYCTASGNCCNYNVQTTEMEEVGKYDFASDLGIFKTDQNAFQQKVYSINMDIEIPNPYGYTEYEINQSNLKIYKTPSDKQTVTIYGQVYSDNTGVISNLVSSNGEKAYIIKYGKVYRKIGTSDTADAYKASDTIKEKVGSGYAIYKLVYTSECLDYEKMNTSACK